MRIYRGGCISYLWGSLNALTSLLTLSLIAIDVPGFAFKINQYIMSFAQMDMLPTNLIYNTWLEFNDEEPLNQYFEYLGYNDTSSIKNMGSTFIFLIINIGIHFVVFLLNIFTKIIPR